MFTPVGNKELLSIRVADEIEDAIHTGKIQIGEKLPSEFELCSQFGVSRTAVREALRMLSAKGMISIEKGRGIFVRGLTSKNVTDPMHSYLKTKGGASYIIDIIEARYTIEPSIASLAAINRNDDNIERMKQDIEAMRTFEGKPEELAILDMDFHLNIARATQNNLLPLMLKPVFRLMPEIKSKIISDVPEARDSALEWHAKILEAIKEKNPEKSFSLMNEHLGIAKAHAQKMMKIEGMIDLAELKEESVEAANN